MNMPTGYQYAKLGSNLEYLRGICSASLSPTLDLSGYPDLSENLPERRYLVVNVVQVLRSLLVQLDELKLPQCCQAAEPLRPMHKEMEDYLSKSPTPQTTFLNDGFAQRLIMIAKQVILAARRDLSTPFAHTQSPRPPGEGEGLRSPLPPGEGQCDGG
jgi:hypothetical protein